MPEKLFINLGNRVKEARLRQNITQDKLSELSNISVRHISKIERGTMNPSYDVLQRLANALGISAGYFFLSSEEVNEKDIQLLTSLYEKCPVKYRGMIVASVQTLSREILKIED